MQLLMEVSGDDPEGLRELVGLILGQLEDLIKKLSAAIQSGAAKEVSRIGARIYRSQCQLRDDSDRACTPGIGAPWAIRFLVRS